MTHIICKMVKYKYANDIVRKSSKCRDLPTFASVLLRSYVPWSSLLASFFPTDLGKPDCAPQCTVPSKTSHFLQPTLE
jgi:hypothetical protein